ncbi:MAG: universal stress protein [Pseudomonas sp.]|uniref:universal stress protein n=1 Tax=Pseudomonas sp. TaxID=306 RepID=UPI002732FDEB|nr:universal stress protein [Pseudomonas sp.]MDP3848848.1 universal stress protein [Pseudomonas sp.]
MNLRQLLVVIDPSLPSQPALQRAQWLSRATGAKIELLLCEYNSALEHSVLFDQETLTKGRSSLLEKLQADLEATAQPLREQGLHVSVQVRWGKRTEQLILQRVTELQPDLVFKSSHHHGPLKRLLFGNSSWQLLRDCPAPLWLVQHGDWQSRSLCAALDPLHSADKPAVLDQQLIAAAKLLSTALEMPARYLHCYPPLPPSLLFDTQLINDYEHYNLVCAEQHRTAFEQLLQAADVPLSSATLLHGFAEQELPRYVREQGIDLLLMGAISRSHLANALIGNTAERVLEAVECDVLALKPQPQAVNSAVE